MGCDIHMIVQRKIDDKWIDTDTPIYDYRNYDLFGMLADVRNGFGFAGVDLGDGFEPILGRDNPRRKLPEDFDCDQYDYHGEKKWMGDHSHSYLLLSELLGENGYYDRISNHRGVVSEEEYKKFKATGYPESACGSISGGMVRNVSNNAMDAVIENPSLKEEGCSYYTQVEWPETYRDSAGEHWFMLLDKWQQLDPDPNNVRIVFGFDS